MKGLLQKKYFAAVIIAALALVLHFLLLDGIPGNMFALALGHDTQCAKGYNWSSFYKVSKNDTSDKVYQLLGTPLKSKDFDDEKYLYYCLSPTDTHYHRRTIVLKDNKVVKKFSSFYVD